MSRRVGQMGMSAKGDLRLETWQAASFANNCLLAPWLSESGVRFVQRFDWGRDFHGTNRSEDMGDGLMKGCATMGQPIVGPRL